MVVKKVTVRVIYDKLSESFRKSLNKVREKNEEKNIHNLRVSIKKLRAFWSLAEITSDQRFKQDEHLKLLKPLFKKLGEIREAQINRAIASKLINSQLLPFNQLLIEQENEAKEELQPILQAIDLKELTLLDQTLQQYLDDIDNKSFKAKASSFILDTIEQINAASKLLPDDNQLHEIRKDIRLLTSTIRILQKTGISSDFDSLYKKLKSLYDIIGNWHDETVFLSSLQGYIQDYGLIDSKPLSQTVSSITMNLEHQQKTIKDQITRDFSKKRIENLKKMIFSPDHHKK